jgi:AraC family transcriptional regulator of arabinose operon
LDFVSRHQQGGEQWVVHLTVEGEYLLSSQGQQQLLGAGQLVFIGPDFACEYQRSPASSRWVHHWVRASVPASWQRWCQPLQQSHRLLLEPLDESLQPMAEQVFADLLQLSALDNAQSLMLNRVEFLFRVLARQQMADESDGRERLDPRVQQALHFISQHYTDNWPVETVAQHCHLSTPRLASLFKQQLGVSPLQWRDQLRMRQARQQLQAGQQRIAELAQQLGYPDALHFSRRFKQLVGVSPRQFRQQRGK